VLHGRRCAARRRRRLGRYGSHLAKPRAPEESGRDGESVTGQNTVGDRPEGHPPWPAVEGLAGARGSSPRGHHLTRERDGEKEGSEAKLTERTNRVEPVRGRRPTRWGGRCSGGSSLRDSGCSSEWEQGKTGEGKGVDGVGLPFEGRARARRSSHVRRSWARLGSGGCGFVRTNRLEVGEGADRWAQRVSGSRGKWARQRQLASDWAGPAREGGEKTERAEGVGPTGRNGGREGT
jgi:hypothetical protein